MKSLMKSKKGILGLDTVKSVILSLLVLAVVFIAVLLALVSLQDAGIFTANTQSDNATDNAINNISYGGTQFFKQVPTFFVLLAVVVLILIIAIVIVAVSRFGGGASRESL